ncbi:MAG: HDOD domain-containing protein [Pseudomonadota bacterium]
MNAIEYANKAEKLFSVPETALKIKELSDCDRADLQSITSVVESDPGLAAHILKLANSAVYRFSRKIDRLDKAIQVIGLSSVYEFALAFAISDALTEEHKKFINVHNFWFQSLSCAIIAKLIATQVSKKNASRLFLAGLFHNIGELAVLKITPTLARECSNVIEDKLPKLIQIDNLGFTYAEISAALLQKWMLPDSVVSAVAMQHFDDLRSVPKDILMIQLSYLGSLCLTYPKFFRLGAVIPSEAVNALDLSEDCVDDIFSEAKEMTAATVSLFA